MSSGRISDPETVARIHDVLAGSLLDTDGIAPVYHGRDSIKSTVASFIGTGFSERKGGVMILHGTPGTGKTALIRRLIMNGIDDEVATQYHSHCTLRGVPKIEYVNALSDKELHPAGFLQRIACLGGGKVDLGLESISPVFVDSPLSKPLVLVVIDEIDALIGSAGISASGTTDWSHLFDDLFTTACMAESRLMLIGICNDLTLDKFHAINKVRTRERFADIEFPSYQTAELVDITLARLASAKVDGSPLQANPTCLRFLANGAKGDIRSVFSELTGAVREQRDFVLRDGKIVVGSMPIIAKRRNSLQARLGKVPSVTRDVLGAVLSAVDAKALVSRSLHLKVTLDEVEKHYKRVVADSKLRIADGIVAQLTQLESTGFLAINQGATRTRRVKGAALMRRVSTTYSLTQDRDVLRGALSKIR